MKYLFLLVVFNLCLVCHTVAQSDTLQWTIQMGGQKSGFFKHVKNADGSYTEWFQFNDRGRATAWWYITA